MMIQAFQMRIHNALPLDNFRSTKHHGLQATQSLSGNAVGFQK